MNKIYNVVWSKAKGCYIVASEFARRNQKITKRVHHKSMMKTALLAPVLAALLATASGVSYANSGISNGANNTIVAGEGAIAAGNGAIAIGENTKADQSNTIAVGNNNQALSQNTVMVGNANKEILYKDTAGIPVATNFDKRTFDSVIYGNRNTVDYNATVPPVNDNGTSGRTIVIGDDNMARYSNRSIVIGNENTSTDQFSVVIGNTAKATNTNSVVIGNGASNGGIEGVAIGSAATVKDGVSWSQAIGSGSLAEGRNSVSLGSQAKTHDDQTVGVGSHTGTYGAGSVALGAGAHTNWRGNTIELSGYKVDGNLATALGYNAQALNKATATGAYSKADGTGSVANGFQARAYAQDGVALGHNSLVGENAKYGVAIGVGADVENEGSVALGSSSMDKKAVAVGESQVTDAQGKTVSYDNAQKDGALTIGVVSVGSETVSTAQVTQPKLTRQIVNVAPGEVSATSTDAINGKQLYNVMVKPITVTGNDDTVGGTKQILGSTLSISAADAGQTTGGATQGGTYLGKNLKTTISNGMVGISMTDSPDFKDVTAKSVTTGNTTMNDGGVTITSPAGASKNVSLTNAGLNNGGNQIHGVAAGSADTDAVNLGQMKAGQTTVESSDNSIIVTNTNPATAANKNYDIKVDYDKIAAKDKYVTGGTASYQTNGDGTIALTGNNGLTATVTGLKDTKVTGASVAGDTLTLTNNDGTSTSVNLGSITSGVDTDTHVKEGNYSVANGKITLPLVDKDGNPVTKNGVAQNVVLDDIASKTAVDQNTTNITKNAGDITKLQGGFELKDANGHTGTITLGGDQKQAITFTGTGAADVSVDGQTVNVDVSGKKIADTINNGGADTKITNIGGTFGLTDGTTATTAEINRNVKVVGDGNITTKGTADEFQINLNKNLNLSPTGSVTTGGTTINNGGVTITNPADASKNVSLTNTGLNNGGNKITNVADGTDDTDAVNYGQLKEVKGNAYKGWTVATGAAATDQQKVGSDKTVTFKGTDFTNTANVNNGKKYGVESSLTQGENPTVTYDLTQDAKDAISKVDTNGIIYATNDGDTTPIKLGKTLHIEGDGTNIKTSGAGSKVTLSLGDTITVGKPGTNGKDGQITVNGKDGKNGVTINGKDGSIGLTGGQGAAGHPGADGKDGQTIIKVIDGKPGTLGINGTVGVKGLDGKDGIDGITRIVYKDPQGTSQTVATLNDGLIFGANSGTDYAAKLNTKVSVKGADANTGADTFANKFDDGKNIMTNVEGDGTIRVALAKDITANSVTTGNTKVDNGGVTITNTTPGGSSVTLTGSGLNNGGNKITNVADGVDDHDAVNYGQLKAVKKEAGKHASVTAGKNVTVSTATNANGGTDYKVSVADKIALSDEGNVTIGDTTALDKDGLKTGNTTVTTDGLTTGNTSVTTDGVTIKQSAADPHKSVTLTNSGLNNGGNQITNVASGMTDASGHATKLEDAVSTNGANIGDLQTLNTNLKNDIEAAKVTVKGQGHIKVTSKTEKASEYTVSAETANLTANNGKVSVAGTDGLTTAQNVADTINKSGWNIQGNGTGDTIVNPGHKVDFVDGDNTTVNVTTTGDKTTVKYDLNDATKEKLNAGITYAANKGQTDGIKLGETLNVKGDDKNIVTHGKDKDLTISLGKDIDLGPDSSLTTSTVNTHSITVTGQGNGNKVTINGSTGTVDGLKNTTTHYQGFGQNGRAATEEQLAETANELVDGVNNSLNNLGNRVNKVGAHAAALSGLHPLDFDPDEKWTFAAGYGHYKNANAAAIGAFYRPNEDTMFSVGGSMGGGENMVNAGVSFKVGQGNHVSTGRVAMAKEIKDLRAELEHVKDALGRVSEGEKLTAMDMDKMKLFPDVPKNHWAYDYVAVLAGNGIIDGFPNGKFEGDRMMTRYEMAALLYRAMQNGAKADERMARALKEFAPELERIRVDTISKHKDGTPDIQRVRVIPGRG
ncbi:MAG: ESPR-type extended signal peptide-containing protein [Veillonellaceae bacterium]|nr:ESPR-type extended signal peptide-containing protein [Veillonellaceae bacterium]